MTKGSRPRSRPPSAWPAPRRPTTSGRAATAAS